MSKAHRNLTLWVPPVALMALIFAFSAMPSSSDEHSTLVFVLRKIAHFSEYALLLALLWRTIRQYVPGDRALALAYGVTVAYAITDELHQTLVSGRVGTWHDVIIDGVGAAAAALLIRRYARTREVA